MVTLVRVETRQHVYFLSTQYSRHVQEKEKEAIDRYLQKERGRKRESRGFSAGSLLIIYRISQRCCPRMQGPPTYTCKIPLFNGTAQCTLILASEWTQMLAETKMRSSLLVDDRTTSVSHLRARASVERSQYLHALDGHPCLTQETWLIDTNLISGIETVCIVVSTLHLIRVAASTIVIDIHK